MTSDTATHAQPAAGPDGDPAEGIRQGQPSTWQRQLLRFGYSGAPHVPPGERLVPPVPEPGTRLWSMLGAGPALAGRLSRWSGWAGPLLVGLLAGVLRFWHLGSPRAVIFDETYYAKDAWSLLRLGYEGSWPDADKANAAILGHPQRIPLADNPSYIVHPPIGKWIIALGEWLFGLHPFGWRFMVAVLGTLSVLLLCRIGRRLFRSTALGCLAGGLLAVDGLHFVMSRTALLDVVVMFWVLAAFGCLLVDRDRSRARLAAALAGDRPDAAVGSRLGLGLRPWRLTAGLCLGLACATKWNGLYVLAAFGLLTVLWDAGARRVAGARRPHLAVLRRDALPAFASLVPVAIVVYLASWAGWFASSKGYFRDWADRRHGLSPDRFLGVPLPRVDLTWVPAPLRSLWHYHAQMYNFHTHLTDPHTYQSNPWSWLILGRPVSYFYESPRLGKDGCRARECAREVLALGTPLLWWVACFALGYLLYRWALRRDWRAGAILCGVAAGYLPWFLYQNRTIFLFYAVVFVPFLCLAVAMLLGAIVGPVAENQREAPTRSSGGGPRAAQNRRLVGAVAAGVLVLLIVWNFVYFWPIYTGQTIPMDAWQHRMWFDTWI